MAEAHLFVDQIEGDLAILVEASEEHPVSVQDLPDGIQEGDWLTADIPDPFTLSSFLTAVQNGDENMPVFVPDEDTGKRAKKRVQSLMDELSG